MTRETKKNIVAGTLAIGLILAWVNSMTLYGALLIALKINDSIYPIIFILSHSSCLIYCSWHLLYRSNSFPGKRYIIALPFVVACLTVSVVFFQNLMGIIGWAVFFIITGIFTGLMICCWMAWYSSDIIKNFRVAVYGKAVALAYILTSLIALIFFEFNQGLEIVIIIIASMILFGGLMAINLPIPRKETKPFVLKNIIPPPKLLLFALVGYSLIALASELVILQTTKQPLFSWLLILLYLLIGFVFCPYIERHGRHYFYILGFLLSGLAYLLILITPYTVIPTIAFALLLNSALIFIHLYYWLSLVEHQSSAYAPLPLAIGFSFELLVFSVVYHIAGSISNDPIPASVMIGIAGIALVMFGFAFLSIYNKETYQLIPSNNTPTSLHKSKRGTTAEEKSEARLLLSYYVMNIGKESFLIKLSTNVKLTKKEQDIAFLIAVGCTNKELMEELYITKNTLKYHLKNIYSKLDVSDHEKAIRKFTEMIFPTASSPSLGLAINEVIESS